MFHWKAVEDLERCGNTWYSYIDESNFKIENGVITAVKWLRGPKTAREYFGRDAWLPIKGFSTEPFAEVTHTINLK